MSGSATAPILTGTITSANVVYLLTIPPIYTNAQQIQGFGPNMAFETTEADIAETQMGVDGGFVGGYRPVPFDEQIELIAASPSCIIFDTWRDYQVMTSSIIYATAVIRQPAVGRRLTRQQGVLVRYSPIAPARQVLEMRTFSIRWGITTGGLL